MNGNDYKNLVIHFSYLGMLAWFVFFMLLIFIELYARYSNLKMTDSNIIACKRMIKFLDLVIILLRSIIIIYSVTFIISNFINSGCINAFREATLLITLFLPIYFWVLIVKRFFKKLAEKTRQNSGAVPLKGDQEIN